jgi:hypothetical protein
MTGVYVKFRFAFHRYSVSGTLTRAARRVWKLNSLSELNGS